MIVIRECYRSTNNKFKISIKWVTKNVISLFPLNDKKYVPSYKIYKDDYFGETERNVVTRWSNIIIQHTIGN